VTLIELLAATLLLLGSGLILRAVHAADRAEPAVLVPEKTAHSAAQDLRRAA